jgi:hypothetical protein
LNHNLDDPENAATQYSDAGVPSINVDDGEGDEEDVDRDHDEDDDNEEINVQGVVSHVFLPKKRGRFCYVYPFIGLTFYAQ